MKYLLTPLTMILWYLITYYGISIGVVAMIYIFGLSWFWLIIGYLFLMGFSFAIANSLPGILRLLILKFYGFSWFSVICHSIAGLWGVCSILITYYSTPPEIIIGEKSIFFLKYLWDEYPIKTIFLVIPFAGLFISLIWSATFAPIIYKFKGAKLENK